MQIELQESALDEVKLAGGQHGEMHLEDERAQNPSARRLKRTTRPMEQD